jgi:hypothetical protein
MLMWIWGWRYYTLAILFFRVKSRDYSERSGEKKGIVCDWILTRDEYGGEK